MVTGHLAVRAAGLLISGVAGAAVVDRLKRPATGAAVKRSVVAVTALTLRGKRRLESGAENLSIGIPRTADDVEAWLAR